MLAMADDLLPSCSPRAGRRPRRRLFASRLRTTAVLPWWQAFAFLLGAAVIWAVGRLVWLLVADEIQYRTCDPDQPLVMVKQNFLPQDVFDELRERSIGDEMAGTATVLNDYNFAMTTGWVVRFNRDGVERFQADERIRWTLPFFNRVADRASNAFVLNLLVCKQTGNVSSDAVGAHGDDTLAILASGDFMAHKVNVLYTVVPSNMEGGELEVWPWEHAFDELNKAVVTPVENTMVEFRGDAYHKVKGFSSPSKGHRIGIVLEQYRVPDIFYDKTVPFCFGNDCPDM